MPRRKQLSTIDKQISALQAELFDLYRQRQKYFLTADDFPAALRAAVTVPAATAETWHDTLKHEWQARGVTIPPKRTLLPKIKAGLTVAAQLAAQMQVSEDLFTLVLIPPVKHATDKQIAAWRAAQPHVRYADKFDSAVTSSEDTAWRLLVIYDALDGLELGSAAQIIATGDYMIAGMDTRALGVREYQIYALRDTQPKDHNVWTWLLKDEGAEVSTVTFMNGAYRFMCDDARGLDQGERFRPAVEVA